MTKKYTVKLFLISILFLLATKNILISTSFHQFNFPEIIISCIACFCLLVLIKYFDASWGKYAITFSLVSLSLISLHFTEGIIVPHIEILLVIACLIMLKEVRVFYLCTTIIILHHLLVYLGQFNNWLPSIFIPEFINFGVVTLFTGLVCLSSVVAANVVHHLNNTSKEHENQHFNERTNIINLNTFKLELSDLTNKKNQQTEVVSSVEQLVITNKALETKLTTIHQQIEQTLQVTASNQRTLQLLGDETALNSFNDIQGTSTVSVLTHSFDEITGLLNEINQEVDSSRLLLMSATFDIKAITRK